MDKTDVKMSCQNNVWCLLFTELAAVCQLWHTDKNKICIYAHFNKHLAVSLYYLVNTILKINKILSITDKRNCQNYVK